MSDALERLKADFRDKLAGGLRAVTRIVGGEELTFFHAPITMRDQSVIRKYLERDLSEGVAMSLIIRARDANGEKMFRQADLTELMRSVDSDVIASIVEEMSTVDRLALDDSPESHQSGTATG